MNSVSGSDGFRAAGGWAYWGLRAPQAPPGVKLAPWQPDDRARLAAAMRRVIARERTSTLRRRIAIAQALRARRTLAP